MKKHIPNMITCCNLLSGAVATYLSTQGAFMYAFCFILLGAFFDFFDGMVARKLGVSGPLGIQMDSLADDITFGLAPAMMVACYLKPIIGWWCVIALLMAAFSALRLAKFNIDTRQTSSFLGLATPSNAIFWGGICSMPYALTAPAWMPWLLLALTLVSCWLLVSEIPFCSLKFKNFTWADNYDKYLFLVGVVVLLAYCIAKACLYGHVEFAFFGGTACITWYVVLNLLLAVTRKK